MNKTEIVKLLTLASSIDNRNVTEVMVEGWYAVLHKFDYADSAAAVRQHFEDSTEYLLPAHVKNGIRRIHEARTTTNDTSGIDWTQKAGDPEPDNMDALSAAWDDPDAWAREIALYDAQLRAAGFAPVGVQVHGWYQPSRQSGRAAA